MLKRLKIKFILVIMAVVTVLFAAMFGLVLHLTKQNLERESIQTMRTLTFRPPDEAQMHRPDSMPGDRPGSRPDKKPDSMPGGTPGSGIRLPYFTADIAQDGTVTFSGNEALGLTDQDSLTEIVREAGESKKQIGLIAGYDLRYLKAYNRNTKTIVFADISSEKSMLRGLMRNCILIGAAAYALLFVISLLLAKWMTRPVEKAWTEQKQFIADASHELKTPLTVIMTNAEMLSDQSYAECDRAQFTDNILATSKRMRGLVESLLELARLDSTRTQLQRSSLDLSKLLNDSLLPFEPLFYENDTVLSSEIEPGITAEGDKDKLRQVITILLDNALKYSDASGTVTVRLKRQPSGCILSVSNAGQPLTKEECRSIFKRFYRVDEARNDGQSYGLGLSIAESIIREHGGKIWAESENGYNTFFVSLPE